MTRIDFHYNLANKLHYSCRLARKVLRADQRAVLFHEEPGQIKALDSLLWTFSPTEFLPHVHVSDGKAAQTPLLLASAADLQDNSFQESLAHHDILIHLGLGEPPHFATFTRLIELVSQDEADRNQARLRVKRYREQGYPVQMHDMGQDVA